MFPRILIFVANFWIILQFVGTQEIDKDVEIISGGEMPHPNGLMGGRSLYANDFFEPQLQPPEPLWKVSAMLIADGASGNNGEISFRQLGPLNPILVNINATGLPIGKHAVHIHAYGDLTEGCKSTGPHIRNVLIGSIDVPESGMIDISFYSSYITLFGHRGIVGRSIVIHEKPIQLHRSPDIYGVPVVSQTINPVSYQTEEMAVGTILACGIITIIENKH